MNTFKTPKGTELPLLNLKGKSYMQIAHRIVWFEEENARYHIDTELVIHDAEKATAKTTIKIFDEQGNVVRKTQDWKTEHAKHFPDYMEKAVSGSLGRALAQAGYGTAFALADLDEGERIVDSPQSAVVPQVAVAKTNTTVVKGSFNQDKKTSEGEW